MIERSNFGNTPMKSHGNIQPYQVTRTIFHASCLTRKLAYLSVIQKTEQQRFGTFKQRLNSVPTKEKVTDTGLLTNPKTET